MTKKQMIEYLKISIFFIFVIVIIRLYHFNNNRWVIDFSIDKQQNIEWLRIF